MATDESLGFEHKGIGSVLAQNRFVVPLNQREYSWEEEHVSELFTDLSDAIAQNKSAYFLGTIVLTRPESGDIPEVSDGQQRLATTTILLAAIRDYFFNASDKKRAASIEQTYLKTTDLDTTEEVPKIKLNVDDHEFFRKLVLSSPDSRDRKTKPMRGSHEKIQGACRIAAAHVQALVATHKDPAKVARLLEWVKFLTSGARVIVLRVPDHLNAFVMFETLNDRGLKASQADLLKNHLLGLCGDRIHEGQQKWAKMLGVLESMGRGDITVTYLHHLLILRSGPTKEREVFDKVKRRINSQARAMEFLDELADSSHDYAALFNADHKKWNEYGTLTRKNLSTINRNVRVEQIRPLMFAVAKFFSVNEGKLAYRMLVSWAVRLLIVGTRGGILDRAYSLRAEEMGNEKLTTAHALLAALSDVIPSDSLFEASFAEARVPHEQRSRYYLRSLELKVKDNPEPEYVPSDEENAINLEHVLPENPGAHWKMPDPQIAIALHKRLGNMVLLQAKKNSFIGNGSFEDKRLVLKASTYNLTQEIGECEKWGAEEISDRQRRLAKLAVATWPLSF